MALRDRNWERNYDNTQREEARDTEKLATRVHYIPRCEAQFSLLSDYARLDLLTRGTKWFFPDVFPEKEKVEEIGDGGKNSLALPLYGNKEGVVEWDVPLPEDLQLKGVMDYPVSLEELKGESISDEVWERRKSALVYALMHYRARKLGTYEELAQIGSSLMQKSLELAEKVDKDKDVEGAHKELLELSESYRQVFEKRIEFLKGIEESVRGLEERALEHLSEEWKSFVKAIEKVPFSADDENLPEGVRKLRNAILEYDEGFRRTVLEAGRLLNDPQEAYSLELSDKFEELLKRVGGERGLRHARWVWDSYYRPIVEVLHPNNGQLLTPGQVWRENNRLY